LESLIMAWGYPALLIGTMLEGETILVIGGYAAHRGYLSFPAVVAIAFVGSLVGDLLCFALGRSRGPDLLERRPGLRAHVARFRQLFERRGPALIVILRFLYGLRIAGPFAIGLGANVSVWRFLLLDALGGLLWAPVVAGVGYAFGAVALQLLAEVERYEFLVLAVLLALALGWRFARPGRPREASREETSPAP